MDIIRSGRRTLALEMRPDGSLLVRAPRRMEQRQILAFLDSRRDWIAKHRMRLAARRERLEAVEPLTEEELGRLRAAAREDMTARAARFAPMVGVELGRVTIRLQRSRWGSCSAKGRLSFNGLLELAPEEIRDYVAVHELCHLRYMDHSPLFWAEVEKVLPDWRERRRWLRDNGPALMARLGPAKQGK